MPETLSDDRLSEELRSFTTFALAMNTDIRFQRQADQTGPGLTLNITTEDLTDDRDRSDQRLSDLGPLMERYRPLRRFLQSAINPEDSAGTCTPITSFRSDVEYRLVKIPEAQFKVAKEVASRLDRIHVMDEAGYPEEAQKEHAALDEYLVHQRRRLLGDLSKVRFSDAVATFGADRLGAADDDCSGVVVFIVIEIFIG